MKINRSNGNKYTTKFYLTGGFESDEFIIFIKYSVVSISDN